MVRITQQNDWVVFIIIGCIFLYIFMLLSLRRDSTVKEFLLQKFPDSHNNFFSWMIISLVFCLLFSVFISQYVPVVPKNVREISLFGYELNKFGFTFSVIFAFYFIRNALTYLFFAGTGAAKKWELFYFTVSKFYFGISLVLMVLCFVSYFYPQGELARFPFYFIAFIALFVFKQLYCFLHPSDIMPRKWYYKFLYICTLQIVPVLVLLKVLFF